MKAYKTEIILSPEQRIAYAKTVGTCRYVYNLFIDTNKKQHEQNLLYLNNYAFSKWLNNEYVPKNQDKKWIKEASSKVIKNVIDNANKAYQKFFKKQADFPRFKKKIKNDCSYYFVRNSKTQPIKFKRHKVNVPRLGYIRLKEYGYIPKHSNIVSGTITKKANKYFIGVITDEVKIIKQNNTNEGIGVDLGHLGIKNFAVLSTGKVFKTKAQKKLQKKLKREQRKLSRKYEANKQNLKKGESTKSIERQKITVAKIHHKIANVRMDYHNKIVREIIKQKPRFITIENLNVKGMMKNRHLSRAIANCWFNMFITKLINKARVNIIEIRKVDRFYPSSKTCSKCGLIKKDFKLSDRTYTCQCENTLNRDLNAAINLKNAKIYEAI